MKEHFRPALTIAEQIQRLQQRGMIIEDETEAAHVLMRTHYYRFMGYAFLLMGEDHRFQEGTNFHQIQRLMDFDAALRRMLMAALESIEVYARTQIAYWFPLNHGKDGLAHYNPEHFADERFHKNYLGTLHTQQNRNSIQLIAARDAHFSHEQMPLWSAVEILSFSSLSKLYGNMKAPDKELIAANMNTSAEYLTNWLHCFSVLRNACAHYNRLYGLRRTPKVSLEARLLRKYSEIQLDTLFAYVIAMLRMMPDVSSKTRFTASLMDLMSDYANVARPEALGFPTCWEKILSDTRNITLKPVSPAKKQIIRS